MTSEGLVPGAATALSSLYPWDVDPSDELTRSVAFLGWPVSAETVVRAGFGFGLLLLAVGTPLALLLPGPWRVGAGLTVVAAALLGVHAVHAGPVMLATARRTSALGDAPDLVARAVLRMRLTPAPERAASFAAGATAGGLTRSLRRHVRRAEGTPRSGLARFGDEWATWFPSLQRSLTLVEAAGSAPASDRGRLLDRSLAVVLDGTEEAMREFAAEIRSPATALYAFGVLLPTALVALVPAAHVAGVAVTPLTVALVYDVLLPLLLLTASAWLLSRRPVAFQPPDVPRDHPAVPDSWVPAVAAAVLAGGSGVTLSLLVLAPWAGPVAGIGFGVGTGLLVRYRPVTSVYDRVRRIEAGLGDALALVGRRVSNGQAVEAAVAETAAELDGEMGDVLGDAARQQRQLKTGLREAFLGEYGVLATVPSPRVESSVALLAQAGRDGSPAGSAVVSLGEHVEDLRTVQAEARHSLEQVCGTLQSTGAVFGPLVAGATVALADAMASGGGFGSAGEPMAGLGLFVGGYVLALAVILTGLAVGLKRGLDGPLLGVRVGRALVLATGSFLGAYVLAGAIA